MSCAGKGYGTNPRSDTYLYSQFIPLNLRTNVSSTRKCRTYKSFYPSFTPILGNLSVTSSLARAYSLVYIDGSNFLPNGTTFVKFGSLYLPVTFYSSFNISFVVPLNAVPGKYEVQVVNIYNGNFSPPVNQSYPGNLNLSESIIYTIT